MTLKNISNDDEKDGYSYQHRANMHCFATDKNRTVRSISVLNVMHKAFML